jgi:hypothetical protein
MTYAKSWRKTWLTVDAGTMIREAATVDTADKESIARLVMFTFKNRLVSYGVGAWTVVASSGKAGGASLVANTDDNWLTANDLVMATSSTADRSWIVLKSPTVNGVCYYITFDTWGLSTVQAQAYFSRSAPDTSSLAINARPAATGYEWAQTNFYCPHSSSRSGGHVQTIMLRAHDGSFCYAVQHPIYNSGLEYGHVFAAQYMFNVYSNKKSWDQTGALSWFITDLIDHIIWDNALANGGLSLHQDGSQVSLNFIHHRAYGAGFLQHAHTDPWTGRWYAEPVWLVSTDTGKKCIRGCLEDVWWAPIGMSDGMVAFGNEIVKAVRIGPFLYPMDQSMGMI